MEMRLHVHNNEAAANSCTNSIQKLLWYSPEHGQSPREVRQESYCPAANLATIPITHLHKSKREMVVTSRALMPTFISNVVSLRIY